MKRKGGRGALLSFACLVAVLAPTLMAPASQAGQLPRKLHCTNKGSPPDLFLADITARGVPCPAARRFIFSLARSHPTFKVEVTKFRGYVCVPTEEAVPSIWVRCTKGRRVIRWDNGT